MATNVSILAAAKLTSEEVGTVTAVITPSTASKTWVIKSLVLTNRESSAIPIKLEAARLGGEHFPILAGGLSLPAGASLVIDYDLTLMAPASGNKDEIKVSATFSAAAPSNGISYVAMGVERDLAL